MRKRILSIFVYQCIVWLLFLLLVNPDTTLFNNFANSFLKPVLADYHAVFILLIQAVSIAAIISYYVISSKVLSIEMCTIKDVLVQIGLTLLFDLAIACIVVSVVLSTSERSGFLDFTGVIEITFAILNAVCFTFATVIIAIIGVVKRKASPRAYKITVICTVVLFILCPLVYQGIGFYQAAQYERNLAQSRQEAEDDLTDMLAAKDAALPYQTDEIHNSGIMDTDYNTNMVFIDYDSNRVGFLYYYNNYQSFPLTEGSLSTNKYTIQKQWDLDEPGKKLTTYYIDEYNSRRTIAIQLEMADQSVYSIDGLETSEEGYSYGELGMSGKGCLLDIDPDY